MKTLLGVNKFPNGAEDWKTPRKTDTQDISKFSAFELFVLEDHLENVKP